VSGRRISSCWLEDREWRVGRVDNCAGLENQREKFPAQVRILYPPPEIECVFVSRSIRDDGSDSLEIEMED
jgi:hypothetical protein